ncbi:MAG: hypothetical protein ACTSW1_19485 [Candidatus Hodarchaeales archaeon]
MYTKSHYVKNHGRKKQFSLVPLILLLSMSLTFLLFCTQAFIISTGIITTINTDVPHHESILIIKSDWGKSIVLDDESTAYLINNRLKFSAGSNVIFFTALPEKIEGTTIEGAHLVYIQKINPTIPFDLGYYLLFVEFVITIGLIIVQRQRQQHKLLLQS